MMKTVPGGKTDAAIATDFWPARRGVWFALALIGVVTFIALSSSLGNGFTNWDDQEYVTNNPLIRTLSWDNIKIIFTTFYKEDFRHPLVLLSFAVEYHFFGLNPFIYHLDNLLLHIANACLVFMLVFALSKHSVSALLAGLLFGVHPLHVESVAWVSERKDVLFALFYLSSMLLYLRYSERSGKGYYLLSLLLFALALLSKAMAVTLPVVLFLCDYLKGRPFDRKTVLEKVPFLFLGILFVADTLFIFHSTDQIKTTHLFSFHDNILTASRSVVWYLTKTVAPFSLSALYPSPETVGILEGPFLFSLLFLVAATVALIYSTRYTRKALFGALFFFITLLPVLKLIPFGAGGAPVADRYMYIPAIGLFFMAGEGVNALLLRKAGGEGGKKLLMLFVIVVIAVFGILSFQRSKVWHDDVTLWSDVVKKYPDTVVAHYNLGRFYQQQGQYDEAVAAYGNALRLNPLLFNVRNNRGTALGQKGEYRQALAEFKEVLRIDPYNIEAGFNLAYAYIILGDCAKGREETRTLLSMDGGKRIANLLSERCGPAKKGGVP